jgi:hypothetical protein
LVGVVKKEGENFCFTMVSKKSWHLQGICLTMPYEFLFLEGYSL